MPVVTTQRAAASSALATHVLIVDDNAGSARALGTLIAAEDRTVAMAHTLRDARRQLAMQPPDLVLLDVQLPDGSGMDLFDDPRFAAQAEVVLMSGQASPDMSRRARRLGAADCLVRPIALHHLQPAISRASRAAPPQAELPGGVQHAAASGHFGPLWGRAAPMRQVYEQVSRVAGTGITVFITGESGTGKELVAQAVHDLSGRRGRPFVAVNCGAISPQLIESEMFGHEKGSFTGAERQHQGFFERASGGTLFLDEITEMPLALQVKLLRVLETGRFARVGATQSQQADVRVIAATNRKPLQAVADGHLREDLMYRLDVFPIALPPLRDRLGDVGLLAEHFVDVFGDQEGRRKQFSAAALQQLVSHSWPGNVRELRNAVQRAYVMSVGDVIEGFDLPPSAKLAASSPSSCSSSPASTAEPHHTESGALVLRLGSTLAEAEQALILATLRQHGHHKERTAAVLGISLKTLYNKLRQYGGRSP